MSLNNMPESGIGITLAYGTGTGTVTYVPLLLLQDDAEFSGFENAIIEIKTLVSPAVNKIVGRADYGGFSGSCYLVNADQGVGQLWSFFASKAQIQWQVMLNDGTTPTTVSPAGVITLGTGTTYTFVGPLSSLHPGNFTGEDAPTLEFEIAISGVVTKNVGT